MAQNNNEASELGAWTEVFRQFAAAPGNDAESDRVFSVLLQQAFHGEADAGGSLSYNSLSGEPITGLAAGRRPVVRTPDSRLTLANFMRSQLYGAFVTHSLGTHVFALGGVEVDSMYARVSLPRTEGVAQRLLAATTGIPVSVGSAPGEGGAWGLAALAGYLAYASESDLAPYLDQRSFGGAAFTPA